MKKTFEPKQTVKAINIEPLAGNDKAPDLELNKEYVVKQIILDSQGNQHLDVGLVSELNYVTSWETKEPLPDGDTIHWCHPSRFELV
jgi:hypothetical protein